jgi:hypothetical protein
MHEIWQQLLVVATIAAAALYVGRRSWLALRGQSSGCGAGCGSCPSNKQDEKVLVELSDFRSAKR